MSYNTLSNYYKTLFQMNYHFKYSLTEMEDMLPFERDLFVIMLLGQMEKEKSQNEKSSAH